MEGVDVSVGVVSEALPGGGAKASKENGCLPADFLLFHV